MLVLDSDGFADDEDPVLRYRLPIGLEPPKHTVQPPHVQLLTDEGGGVLSLRLGARWPELTETERRVPVAGVRFRIVTRGLDSDAVPAWSDANPAGDVLVDRRIPLTRADAEILRGALEAGGAAVDVEIELTVRGRTPTWPWIVRADGPALAATLRALVGLDPVPWQRIVDVWAGLGGDELMWRAVEPGAIPPPEGEARSLALAAASRSVLLVGTDDGWVVGDDVSPQIDLSLAVPTVTTRTATLLWSFSDFLDSVADRAEYVADLAVPRPLEASDLHVVNDVPLSLDGVRRIDVDVRTGGPSGSVSCSFAPGQPDAARLRFVRVTGGDQQLMWRTRTTVDVGGQPAVVSGDPRPTGLLLRLTPALLGLAPVRVEADPAVVSAVAAVEVTLGQATVRLDASKAATSVVGRNPPTSASVVLVDPDGSRTDLGALRVHGGRIAVTAATIGVGELTEVRFEAADPAALAYLAVQVEEAGWRTVDPGTAVAWPVRRRHRGAQATVRYRTRTVARSRDGVTTPMTTSDWRTGVGPIIAVGA